MGAELALGQHFRRVSSIVYRHVPHLLVLADQLLLDCGGKPFGLRDRVNWLWLGL